MTYPTETLDGDRFAWSHLFEGSATTVLRDVDADVTLAYVSEMTTDDRLVDCADDALTVYRVKLGAPILYTDAVAPMFAMHLNARRWAEGEVAMRY